MFLNQLALSLLAMSLDNLLSSLEFVLRTIASWKLPLFLIVISIVASSCLLYWHYAGRQRRQRHKLPPGPPSRLFLGPRGIETREKWLVFMRWSEQYSSDIIHVSIWPFVSHAFILNSHASLHDALLGADSGDALAGRPTNASIEIFNPGNCGLALATGARFQEQRRWALHTLRSFGFGKNLMEKAILEELVDLRAKIEAHIAKDSVSGMDTALPISASIANVLSVIVFGERLGGDPEFERMRNQIETIVQNSTSQVVPMLFAPLLTNIPGDAFGIKKLLVMMKDVRQYVAKKMEMHTNSFDPNNIRDYIDCFILEANRRNQKESDNTHFFQGMETTSTTLRWALLLMATYRDIQERVRSEIVEQIGRDRLPQYADRGLLPFTEAVLCEVHRFVSIAPLGIIHSAEKETKVREYTIPKDSLIFTNLYAVHRQTDLWPDPHHFNPEANFMKYSNGKVELKNTEFLVQFGIGKRQCLGEILARQEQFLFFVGILQRFRLSSENGKTLPSVDQCVPDIIRLPLLHELHFSLL